ncbi:zinc-ribbon domain-containing protein [Haloplanus litoreus]|uniref:zinc-ribbon domain-containing protein n=1 Tax=Haloplanus litoreus TaxID=767515 RepID=UPI003620E968
MCLRRRRVARPVRLHHHREEKAQGGEGHRRQGREGVPRNEKGSREGAGSGDERTGGRGRPQAPADTRRPKYHQRRHHRSEYDPRRPEQDRQGPAHPGRRQRRQPLGYHRRRRGSLGRRDRCESRRPAPGNRCPATGWRPATHRTVAAGGHSPPDAQQSPGTRASGGGSHSVDQHAPEGRRRQSGHPGNGSESPDQSEGGTRYCTSCGEEVEADWNTCISCGADL